MALDLVTDIVILESKIESFKSQLTKLISKHQDYADNYHRHAERLYNQGHFEQSSEADKLAHPHESFVAELRLVLKHDY